jgi:hypothetical protein
MPSRRAALSQESARSIYAQIEAATPRPIDSIQIEGLFNGGSIRRLRFEIEVIESGERFSGQINEQAIGMVRGEIPLGSLCRAVLQPHLEISQTTGEESTTYELVDISLLGDST